MNARAKSKVVNKKTSNKNKSLLVLIVLNIILICFLFYINPMQVYRNHKFKDNIVSLLDKETITLEELIPFEFDSVYLFDSYNTKENIEKVIGFKSRFVKDNSTDKLGTEVIVVKDKKVISSIFVNISEDGFTIEKLITSNRLDYNTGIQFKVESYESGVFIRQYVIDYIAEFYDISFVLPGDWWKDDWEEDGDLYYLDENSTDHFIINKYKKLSLKDYKKKLEKKCSINKTEEYYVNNFDGYLIVGESLDMSVKSYNLMLNVGKDVYTFSLNSNRNDARTLLAKVVTSIKYDEKKV